MDILSGFSVVALCVNALKGDQIYKISEVMSQSQNQK